MKNLILCLTACLCSSSLFAQNWVQSYQQSVDAYSNYQSAEALELGLLALDQLKAESDKPSKNQATILRQLSIVAYDLGDDGSAIEYAQEEVRTLTITGDSDDMNFANALQNLAVLRMFRSEYGAAEPLLENALEITLTYNSDDSYETGLSRGHLARVWFHLKKDDQAKAFFDSAYNTMNQYEEVTSDYYSIVYDYGSFAAEKGDFQLALKLFSELEEFYNYETPNYEYGSMLIKVGDVLDQLGQFSGAVEKYELAVSNFRELGQTDSEEYAIALNNLTIDLQKLGKFEEATTLVEELLEQRSAGRETEPKSYATTLTNYANLLIRKGDLAASGDTLKAVLAFYQEMSLEKDQIYLNALESYSGILLTDADYQQAEETINEAIGLATEKALQKELPTLFNQKARILAQLARYDEAKTLAEEALQKAGNYYGPGALKTAYIKNTMAGILAQLGEYDAAEELYLEILPVFTASFGENHPEYATIAANYSSLLQLDGAYYTAEYYLKKAVEVKREAFGIENRDYLTTYENLALLYSNTARYTEANQLLTEIKLTKEKLLDSNDPALAYTLTNLGSVKKQLAEYTEAEQNFKTAQRIYKETLGEDHLFYASVINNLALLYQKMGNTTAARPLFEQALNIYETRIGKLNPDYATALENLATLYQMEEAFDKAKALLEEVLVIDEQILGTEHPLYSKTLHNLASIYEENGEYERSKELYEKALTIYRQVFGEMHPSYASTLYNLAALEQEMENYAQAKTYFEQVTDIRRSILGENHPDYAYSLYGLASILQKTGDFEGARPIYLEVTGKYLDYIQEYFPALSESEKSAFYGKIKPVFDSYLDYIIEYNLLTKGTDQERQELVESMYNQQLATKALLLNASNKVRNTILSSGDSELIALFNDWVALKENIVKAYSMSKEEIERSQIDIEGLEQRANETEKNLSLKSAAFASEFEKERITWERVRENLAEDEAAIEVFRIQKKMKTDSVLYAALLLTGKPDARPQLIVQANGLEMEQKGFRAYKNFIMYKLADAQSYEIFWQAFDRQIAGDIRTIYLSADGVLNKVNISTLFDPETKTYMVDKYFVRLLSNTRELAMQSSVQTSSNSAEMFGYPLYYLSSNSLNTSGALFSQQEVERSFGETITMLPGTLEEIRNIEALFEGSQWEYKTYTEAQATEAQIKKLVSPKILHIATHGFFLEDIQVDSEEGGLTSRNAKFNPLLRSGLLLAGAENTVKNEDIPGDEDGILTAYEAMNLNLDHTELVVMSACETGLGEVKNGEGVYGLQRSFLVAGADNLIMSLWKVNDETTQLLMSQFYKNWFAGQERLEAFNNAIAEVRKNFNEPYYWGAFVMLGK